MSILVVLSFITIGIFWYIFENKKDWIIQEIEQFVNQNHEGEIKIDRIAFLPFKYFPKTGFRLSEIKYYISKNSTVRDDEPPFIEVNQFELKLDLRPLIKLSKIKVDNINIRGIQLYIKKNKIRNLSFSDAMVILSEKIMKLIDEFDIGFLKFQSKEEDILPNINFNIIQFRYLSKEFENIENIDVNGQIYGTNDKIHLEFHNFDLTMPCGSISFSAKTSIGDEGELKIYSQLKIKDFQYNDIANQIDKVIPYIELKEKLGVQDSLAKINLDINLSALFHFDPFKIKHLQIEDGKMEYIPINNSKKVFDRISLDADNVSFNWESKSTNIVGLKSINGKMGVEKIEIPPFSDTSVKIAFSGQNNNLNVSFNIENPAFSKQEGNVNIDFSNQEKTVLIHCEVKDIDTEKLFNSKKNKKISRGKVDLLADFHISGLKKFNLNNNLVGKVVISSKKMTMYGMDIDALLKSYQRTQKFNLMDVSAFLLTGPIGTAATKGSDWLKLSNFKIRELDSTLISNFIAELKISNGQLITEDVAIATVKNRIAFEGTIDFVKYTIPNFTIFVLDKDGCAKIKQNFYGKMDNIQIEKIKGFQVVAGPIKNAVNSVFGKKCKPVYFGIINHPISR
ncbi:MAG: hypothetical protein L3J34_03370 [Flavobacteriaceae bacterium]|nr:hypothetical protein [Flavobacteriaceae bacterium]